MNKYSMPLDRRRFLAVCGAGALSGLALSTAPFWARAGEAEDDIHRKKIPSSGEAIPVIGMGTWITFNVGDDQQALNRRVKILETFFARGGTMVDSSPMYGTAEKVMGYCLERLASPSPVFSATKVWTRGNGPSQIAESADLWGLEKFDLLQVHNLLKWREHLDTLKDMKEQGRLRYIGITTSHGRRHSEMEAIMRSEPLDFIQLTYNILDREAEERLLPLAAEKGIAVIANRPFQQKNLFHRFAEYPLPGWAGDIDCANWAQFFLKFVVSHPAVACAIPATSQLAHMRENMGALTGRMPDSDTRERMTRYVQSL